METFDEIQKKFTDEPSPHAHQPAVEIAGAVVIKLSKPFKFEDYDLTEIKLDLDGLTGESFEEVEKEYGAAGMLSPVKENDKAYCMMIAAQACGIPYAVIKKLPGKDVVKIARAVTGFLFNPD